MNMNYLQMPYEGDLNDDSNNKLIMPPMGMLTGCQTQPATMPLNMAMNPMPLPMGNLPMQMPTASQMSYSMPRNMVQSPPMSMMPPMQTIQPMQTMQQLPTMQQIPTMQSLQSGNQMNLPPMSMQTMSQLPPGAVTPLSSMMIGGGAGGIDGGGMNVVVPDLQPLSAMSQMSQNNQAMMPQMHQQQARMAGGYSPNSQNMMYQGNSQMMPNNMWNYAQNDAALQQQQAQQQQQQQQQRMNYASQQNSYREARNGLNSPSINDTLRFTRGSNGSLSGKKVPHWR